MMPMRSIQYRLTRDTRNLKHILTNCNLDELLKAPDRNTKIHTETDTPTNLEELQLTGNNPIRRQRTSQKSDRLSSPGTHTRAPDTKKITRNDILPLLLQKKYNPLNRPHQRPSRLRQQAAGINQGSDPSITDHNNLPPPPHQPQSPPAPSSKAA